MNKKIPLIISILIFSVLSVLYMSSDEIFQNIQDPRQPFQTYLKPPAPNYNYESSWLSLPDLSNKSIPSDTKRRCICCCPKCLSRRKTLVTKG